MYTEVKLKTLKLLSKIIEKEKFNLVFAEKEDRCRKMFVKYNISFRMENQ